MSMYEYTTKKIHWPTKFLTIIVSVAPAAGHYSSANGPVRDANVTIFTRVGFI